MKALPLYGGKSFCYNDARVIQWEGFCMKKRIFAALGALLLLLMLTACAGQTAVNAAQSLRPAEMTEEENAVLALLGGSQTSVFDFTTDNALRSVRVERYELQNGAWKAFGGGSFAVSGEKGRIALTMNPNSGEIRFAVQDDHGTSAIKQAYPEEDLTGLAVATSALSAPTAIVTDQEIPLMVQILDSGDKTVSYSPEYFFHPEEYEKLGCERVYAVTVTFSSDSLS